MTKTEIESLFYSIIEEKAIYNKLEGVSRNAVFNWINGRTKPTFGDMVNVLFQLDHVEIKLKNPITPHKDSYEISSKQKPND